MAEAQGNQNNGGENKTFTQAEVDQIVGERLARERGKYADYEDFKTKAAEYDKLQESQKTEIQKAQEKAEKLQKKLEGMEKAGKIRDIRDKVSRDTGVPADLLTGEDEESCKTQAESILKFAKGSKYPGVKGSEHKTGSQTGGSSETEKEAYRELAGQIFGRKE